MHYAPVELLEWVKGLPKDLIDLGSSGIHGPTSLRELLPHIDDLPITGDNHYGHLQLKEALAARYGVSTDQIAITPGASMGNFCVMAATLRPGDAVAVETPAYGPFLQAAELITGVRTTPLPRNFESGFQFTDPAVLGKLTPKLVVVSNLHNPSGVYLTDEVIHSLGHVCEKSSGWLLVDEIFLPFLEGGDRRTSAVVHEKVVTTCSLTKVWGLNRMRIGWVIAREDVIRSIQRIVNYYHVQLPFIAERIASEVLTADGVSDRLLSHARRRASENLGVVTDCLDGLKIFEYIKPAGGISLFARFCDGRRSDDFCKRLLEAHRTWVVPGRFFGAPDGLRISFGCDREVVLAGVKALSTLATQYEDSSLRSE